MKATISIDCIYCDAVWKDIVPKDVLPLGAQDKELIKKRSEEFIKDSEKKENKRIKQALIKYAKTTYFGKIVCPFCKKAVLMSLKE